MMEPGNQYYTDQIRNYHHKRDYTIVTTRESTHSELVDNSGNNSSKLRHSYNVKLLNGTVHNGDLMSGTKLKVNTKSSNGDTPSSNTSTINVNNRIPSPIFHLLSKSSMNDPRVERPSTNRLKVDVYSVSVTMESKITGTFDPELFKVEAVAPTGRMIKMTGGGQYVAQFNVDDVGQWSVAMYYNGKYLDGCPVDVCDPSQVKVHDLKGGLVGNSNTFHVDCTKAGPGELGVDITHNGRHVQTQISSPSFAYRKISFVPHEPGAYEINVHFNRAEVREDDGDLFKCNEKRKRAVFITGITQHDGYIQVVASCDWKLDYITGWPFICHVTDVTDVAIYSMKDGTVCKHPEMIADCTHVGDGIVEAEVSYNGQRRPCKINSDKLGIHRIQFQPQGPGIYKVWISFEGRPVKGSPFIQEIAELEKPTAHGEGLYQGVLGKPASFIVDTKGLPGQISVTVNGPSKSLKVQLEPGKSNTIKVVYYPTERGPHTIHIKMDRRDIEGSPFRSLVVDPVDFRVSREWIPLLDQTNVIPLSVNQETHLPFDISEAGPGELNAEVKGPNGNLPVAIDARHDGKHFVIFTPTEEGRHDIHVSWRDYPLSKSPYHGYATSKPDLDEPYNASLVPVPVQHIERSSGTEPESDNLTEEMNRPTDFVYGSQNPNFRLPEISYNFEPLQTKVQALPAYVDNTHSKQRHLDSTSQGLLSPTGFIKLNDESSGSQRQHVSMSGLQRQLVSINGSQRQPALTSGSQRQPVSTSGLQRQPALTSGSQRQPALTSGSQGQHVSMRDSQRQHLSTSNTQKITLRGEGLKKAKVDKLAQFTIDGNSSSIATERPIAYLQGVNDQMHTTVTTESMKANVYKCTYIPKQPGVYLLYIDWGDRPLKGSPFKVDVHETDKSNKLVATVKPGSATLSSNQALKVHSNYGVPGSPYTADVRENQVQGHVKVWGPGIEDGIIPHFQSTFWVDTSGVKPGDMSFRIVGPKGAFHVSVHKLSKNNKIYECFYDPVESGIYTIIIHMSGAHVSGSPYTVMLATSAQELREMQEDFNENSSVFGDDVSMITQKVSKYQPPQELSSDDIILY